MKLRFCLLFSVSIISHCCGALNSPSGCTWDLNTQLPFNEPIYLNASGETVKFVIPENSNGLHINQNEPLLLLCPGRNNVISKTDSNEATVRCAEEQNVFLGSNKKMNLEQLECSKNSMGDGKITNVTCGNGGHIIKLGYNTTLGWVNLINACYDDHLAAALYSEHTIYGAAMAGSSKQSLRPSFHTFGVPKDIHPAQAYSQRGQIKSLSKILDKDLVTSLIKGGSSYLARGHLAPDADFLYGSWQFATYFFVNAVPQWQQVNGGNWKRLEGLVRQFSEKIGHNLKIFTGSYGVLSLASSSGDVPLYLASDERLPVPKWTWKIVQSEKTQQAIAFASLNNPFAQNITKSEILCKNICKTSNWYHKDWDNFSKGYTICCKVEDLIKKLRNKLSIKSSGILKGLL